MAKTNRVANPRSAGVVKLHAAKRPASKGAQPVPGGDRQLARTPQPKLQNRDRRHTLVVSQPLPSRASRTWSDFGSVSEACEDFIKGYERELRSLNPGQAQLTYW